MSENKNDSRASETTPEQLAEVYAKNQWRGLDVTDLYPTATDLKKWSEADYLAGYNAATLKTSPLQEQLEKLQEELEYKEKLFRKEVDYATEWYTKFQSSQEETSSLKSQLEEANAYTDGLCEKINSQDREIERLRGGRGNETPTDEEISAQAFVFAPVNIGSVSTILQHGFRDGAKWMREQFVGPILPPSLHDPSFKTPNNQ